MKLLLHLLAGGVLLISLASRASATIRYVDVNSFNSTPPYTNWATAANTIQQAIDVALAGDKIVVTNGVYAAGGRAVHGTMTNRVAVIKPVTLQSVNGARATVISGAAAAGGHPGIRCLFLASNAVLNGFTLTNGHTLAAGDAQTELRGGGAWCEPGASIADSIIVGNVASGVAGGVYGGSLRNCEIAWNMATDGGGAYGALLFNCTVVTNRATDRASGGTAYCTNSNSIVYFNQSSLYPNHSGSAFFWSCTTPLPAGGEGNLTNAPGFVDLEGGVFRLKCGSPCIDAGTDLGALMDHDLLGFPRPVDADGDGIPAFDIGAYERNPAREAQNVGIRAGFTNFAVAFSVPFVAQLEGCTSDFWWGFGDGSVISNKLEVVHSWAKAGRYDVTLTAQFPVSEGVGTATAAVDVVEPTYYVNADNPTPVFPFITWATAATNIQDAVNAGTALGRLVLVTNGVYRTGGAAVHGTMTNRVALKNGVRLQSVNGPEQTVIEGSAAPGGGNGDGAVRGVYVDNLSIVSGFTITNGHTLASSTVDRRLHNGGGVWCEDGAMITNCVLVGNSANFEGGGISGGNVGSNRHNGAAYACRLIRNTGYYGGGAAYSTLFNCLVLSNTLYTVAGGGGALWSTLNNCTVLGNAAGFDGGVHGGTLNNCIVYFNSPQNYSATWAVLSNCCTTPMPPGTGNITDAPVFFDLSNGNLRLQSSSPCINAGDNSFAPVPTDLDGHPRIIGGTVDIGAYEFQSPASMLFCAWLQQFGLPTDGSADFADADLDGYNNWQEWRADTVPTNALSRLTLVMPTNTPTGMTVAWQSVPTRSYFLERGTNVTGPSPIFAPVATGLPGQSGTTTFTDTAATNGGPFFYRVGVQ